MSKRRVVLVEYFVAKDQVILFAAHQDSPHPEVVRLEVPVDEMRSFATRHFSTTDGVRRLTSTDLQRWEELFAPLLSPLTGLTAPDDIVWFVPHDVLHRLPLHALPVEGGPLIERNPVCYSPSASVMKYCHAKRKGRRDVALVIGDPRGDLGEARAEAMTVADLFGASPLIGGLATKLRVQAALDDQAGHTDLIHFACHGRLDRDDAWKSGLTLADGTLTAEEVLNLRFHADLVTLSACESGLNEHRPGDELLGLTRALIYAGTPSVLVSLWTVHDLATRLLMERFYRALRSEGPGGVQELKAVALQKAQLAVRDMTRQDAIQWRKCEVQRLSGISTSETRGLLEQLQGGQGVEELERHMGIASGVEPWTAGREDTPFAHPYYWAAFVLVGDWR